MLSIRKRLCLGDKLKIIDENKKGKTLKEISLKYDIPKSSVCTILKNCRKVIRSVKGTHAGTLRRQSLKKGEYQTSTQMIWKHGTV